MVLVRRAVIITSHRAPPPLPISSTPLIDISIATLAEKSWEHSFCKEEAYLVPTTHHDESSSHYSSASRHEMAAVYKTLSKGSSNGHKDEATTTPAVARKNKQRVLILSSRGVTYRHRHLINDLCGLLPHSKKDVKFDSKSKLYELNELAQLNNCNNVLFFEARKGMDLYMWVAKAPNGPTIKLHLTNLHTMEELNFVGNCLKGSRPVLSFDAAFDNEPHLKLMKEMFQQVFGVPQGARKSKPFVDHVMGFTVADGKIWIRIYEIKESAPAKSAAGGDDEMDVDTDSKAPKKGKGNKGSGKEELDITLVEVGPRFVLEPIVILEGGFGGPKIYENKQFVSPNQVRADFRRRKASKHTARAEQDVERLAKKGDLGLRTAGGKKAAVDELDTRTLFA
ncbi:Brix-domain-containing protein [Xylariomycetidae sp. FL2044]|nr:Brix-domain-containing protein [Xylariomycetidae sp. FL2044]